MSLQEKDDIISILDKNVNIKYKEKITKNNKYDDEIKKYDEIFKILDKYLKQKNKSKL